MTDRWSDLGPRLASAVVMLIVGLGALWMGGVAFIVLVCLCSGVMLWELARMVGGANVSAILLGLLGVVATPGFLLAGAADMPGWMVQLLPFVMVAPALAGAIVLSENRRLFAGYACAIIMACAALLMLRMLFGFWPVLTLIGIVVATDIAGYFAGRIIGGPKFWPAVSPKKTWSGTVAGWVGAGAFVAAMGGALGAIAVAMALSFASQLGDIAESALKRKMGVKDASALIPGHGGLLDRFDGLAGASLVALVLLVFLGFSFQAA